MLVAANTALAYYRGLGPTEGGFSFKDIYLGVVLEEAPAYNSLSQDEALRVLTELQHIVL